MTHAPADLVLSPRDTGQLVLGNVSRQGTGAGGRASTRKAGFRHLFPLPTGTFPGPALASGLLPLPRPSGPNFPTLPSCLWEEPCGKQHLLELWRDRAPSLGSQLCRLRPLTLPEPPVLHLKYGAIMVPPSQPVRKFEWGCGETIYSVPSTQKGLKRYYSEK